jgi:hypothetical protein
MQEGCKDAAHFRQETDAATHYLSIGDALAVKQRRPFRGVVRRGPPAQADCRKAFFSNLQMA